MNRTERDLLTAREWEVLSLVREGLTNDQIAERLGISRDGVKYHVSEILGKLGLSDRIEAAAWYSRNRPLVQRYAVLAWPLSLLRRLNDPRSLLHVSAGAVISVAVLVFVALAAGVAVMATRSSDEPSPPLAQSTATPQPQPTPELPTFAPGGRTGNAALDAIIEDFLTMTAEELAEAYAGVVAREFVGEVAGTYTAEGWATRLAAADRSLYAVLTEPAGTGISPARDVNIILREENAPRTTGISGWRLAVQQGQVVDIIIAESPESLAGDVGFNYSRFLVLPPQDELPEAPPSHPLSLRSGDPGVDGILGLLEAGDANGLAALADAPVIRRQCSSLQEQRDDLIAEELRTIARQVSGVHAVADLPDGYLPAADNAIILLLEQTPYSWHAAALLEREGRIVGLDLCPAEQPQQLYPPQAYPAPPLVDLGDLDTSRRSGVEIVDTFLEAMAAGDVATMLDLISYERQGCIVEPVGIGGPPFCQQGEAAGTILDVFLVMACEGVYLRQDELQPTVASWSDGAWALYAVADIGTLKPGSEFLRGNLQVVLVDTESQGPPNVLSARTLSFSDQGLTAIRYSCSQQHPEAMLWPGSSPDFLLPPP